jgi:hypothetical protein
LYIMLQLYFTWLFWKSTSCSSACPFPACMFTTSLIL